MLDFHSHILPGIDDGSKNLEMSLAMLRESSAQGIRGIALTPHFYADSDDPDEFFRRREAAADSLFQAAQSEPDCPELLLGAEVHYYRGMGQSDILEQFCIGDSNLVLVEMPFRPWSRQELRDLEDIRNRLGLQVLIAHVERYLHLARPEDIDALKTRAGALIQANAEFFLQLRTRRKALRMLERGEIHLLGSDCHDMDSRAPDLGDAVTYIRKKLGPDILAEIDRRGQRYLAPSSPPGTGDDRELVHT